MGNYEYLEPPRVCSCGAMPGEQHSDLGCDIARCASSGIQWIQCEGELHIYNGRHYGQHEGPCVSDIWTGWYPGMLEAVERGWFVYFGPPWIPCDPTHPGATPDLNRVGSELRWNPATQRHQEGV